MVTAAHRAWIFPDTVAFPERLQDPQLQEDFPPEIYDEVQSSFKNWHALGYFCRTDREMLFRERGVKQFIEAGAVHGHGHRLGHADELPHRGAVARDQGPRRHGHVAAARDLGARRASTPASSASSDDLGTIEPGKLADIIVVNGNPLFDITALAHVEVVVKDGVVHKGGPPAPGRGTASARPYDTPCTKESSHEQHGSSGRSSRRRRGGWYWRCAAVPAAAQVVGANLSGSVLDKSKAALPGVTVTLRNTATGREQVLVTDAEGRYRAVALQPGPYEVVAELTGFGTAGGRWSWWWAATSAPTWSWASPRWRRRSPSRGPRRSSR